MVGPYFIEQSTSYPPESGLEDFHITSVALYHVLMFCYSRKKTSCINYWKVHFTLFCPLNLSGDWVNGCHFYLRGSVEVICVYFWVLFSLQDHHITPITTQGSMCSFFFFFFFRLKHFDFRVYFRIITGMPGPLKFMYGLSSPRQHKAL